MHLFPISHFFPDWEFYLLVFNYAWVFTKSLEGRWELYRKHTEKNCFSYFLSMQSTNRDHLAGVALSDCQEDMAVPVGLLDAEKIADAVLI